ncbi:uncharacterized protein LOC120090704 [Benincasa hispida]|uniref:uncharacterized protein LOC120090704 n=1 Tax=Benincasa hispida TaxID=102211 RepID=UPI00190040D9|nr:uncharacterized protein LOC120090704 [Benincasa hispida]
MDITTYFNKLPLIWQEMDLCREMVWNCPCGGGLHYQSEETDRVYDFLAGLNSKFDAIRSQILGTHPIPSLMEVCSKVHLEEDRSSAMNNPLVSLTNSTAFKALSSTNDNQNSKPTPVCEHCKKPRHTKHQCWKLHGRPLNGKRCQSGPGRALASESTTGGSQPQNQETNQTSSSTVGIV